LKKGDLVAVVATPERVLITPREVVASKALDQLGAILGEQGLYQRTPAHLPSEALH
jgi:hypothetical protein